MKAARLQGEARSNPARRCLEVTDTPAMPRTSYGDFWRPASVLAAVVLLAYLPLGNNGFVTWDDPLAITDNVYLRFLNRESLRWMATTFHTGNWIPLTWFSLALDYQVHRLDPRVFHFTNLALHIANTLLVFGFCRRLLFLARPTEGNAENPQWEFWSAFLAALLFGLHPIHVESVAWATERKDVLYAFFYLSALWLYLDYGAPNSRFEFEVLSSKLRWFLNLWFKNTQNSGLRIRNLKLVFCFLLFALSLMSKPMAVTLPAAFLALDFWPLRRWRERRWRKAVLEKIPFFLLGLIFGGLTFVSQATTHAFSTLEGLTFQFRVMNAFRSLVFYLWKMAVPLNLVPLYPVPRDGNGLYYAQNNLAMAAVLAFTLAAWVYRRKKPYLAAAWLFYLATLAPVLGIVQVGSQAAADRYTYVPSLAFFLPLAAGIMRWADQRSLRIAVTSFFALVLGALTWNQLALWRDSITLWESVTAAYPDVSQIAHTNLANAYKQAGRPDDALREYDRAMAIPPPQAFTHDGKGTALLDEGRTGEAITEFKTAIELDPHYASPHRNLWFAYRRNGMRKEALAEIQQAAALDPHFADAFSDLGISYGEMGRGKDAEEAFQKALALDPTNTQYLMNLATTYQREHQWADAVEGYRKVLALDSGNVMAWFDLGNTDLLSGDYADAAQALQNANQLTPGQKAIERKLADVYSKLGQNNNSAP